MPAPIDTPIFEMLRWENWEGLGEDPTALTIDEETEQMFESRTHRMRPTPEAFSLALDMLRTRVGQRLVRLQPHVLAEQVFGIGEHTVIKFFARHRKEDARITHLLVAITGGPRRLLDGREWEEEEQYRRKVECFEQLPLSKAILSPPVVLALDEWRRYAEGGPLSRSNLEAAAGELD